MSSLRAFALLCANFPWPKPAVAALQDLPALAAGITLEQRQTRPARFYGGIAADGIFHNPLAADDATAVNITFAFEADPAQMGQAADIFIALAYAAPGPLGYLPEQWFLLDARRRWHVLQGPPQTWPVFARLDALPATYQAQIYQGTFQSTGTFRILPGYRAADGALVYSPQGITGTVSAAPLEIPPAAGNMPTQWIADFDGDGQDDLLLYADGSVTLQTWLNGRWQTLWDSGGDPENPLSGNWAALRAGDFDHDGGAEISIGDRLYQFRNGAWMAICALCPRLTVGGEFSGIFSLGADAALRRSYYNNGWRIENIAYDGAPPAALAHGNSVEYGKIYGVNQDGQLFNTWYDGSQVNFGLLDETSAIQVNSAAHGRDRDVYALKGNGDLVHAAYTDRWLLTEFPGLALQVPLLPIDNHWPAFKLAAVDHSGRLLLVTAEQRAQWLADTADLRPGTLVMNPWGEGLFALDSAGRLVQISPSGPAWTVGIQPAGPLLSLHAGPSGAYGNLYGVTPDGAILNTWHDGSQIHFSTLPSPRPIQADSLAVNDNGVFGLTYNGELLRLYWDGTAWQSAAVPHWGGDLRKPLRPGDLRGSDANILGLNEFGRIFTTWNNNGEITFALVPDL